MVLNLILVVSLIIRIESKVYLGTIFTNIVIHSVFTLVAECVKNDDRNIIKIFCFYKLRIEHTDFLLQSVNRFQQKRWNLHMSAHERFF